MPPGGFMKKILFLIHDLAQGGAEKVLVNLVNHMDRSKFDITVLALFGGGVNEQFLHTGIRLINCHKHALRGNSHIMKLFTPKQLFRFYIRDHYDIIVSYLEGPCARIVSGCDDPTTKLVSWIHIEQKTSSNASRSFRSFREAASCYSRFHKTICVSETVKSDFLSLFPEVSNVAVLYNTNDTARILSDAKQTIDGWPADKSVYHLIAIGKIVPTKGFDRLARIHKRLLDAGCRVHTYILGTGPQQKSIQKYLDENGLSDRFTFLGYQTNPYQYLSKCDLFVCASYAEGFSTAATEALIVGTPVITTRVAGMEEMLGDNEFGIITDNSEDALFDGILKLLQAPERLAHYKRQALTRGKDFHTQNCVEAVELMLERL